MGNHLFQTIQKANFPVVEQALETAALMLGSDKSRGYCLEMICADFLAEPPTQETQSEVLVLSLERLYKICPTNAEKNYSTRLKEGPWKNCVRNDHAVILSPEEYDQLKTTLDRDGWKCQFWGRQRSTSTSSLHRAARRDRMIEDNLMTLCASCHRRHHNFDAGARTFFQTP